MCADASDEMLLLIRFFDDEAAEVASMSQKVTECVTNLNELFGDSAACLTRLCFTKQMVLKTPRRPTLLNVRQKDLNQYFSVVLLHF